MHGKYRTVKGDLFEMTKDDKDIIICHVVNNQGAWGSGFVVPLGKYFPHAEKTYREWAEDCPIEVTPFFELGETLIVEVSPKVHVAHLCAQILGSDRPLYYNKLAKAMDFVASHILEARSHGETLRIVAPKFGSARAGGNWEFVKELIEDCWIKQGIDVAIYEI